MKKRSALITGTWALSCGAAFLAGRTTSESGLSDEAPNAYQQPLSTRSAASRTIPSSDPSGSSGAPGSRFRASTNPGGEEAELKEAVLAGILAETTQSPIAFAVVLKRSYNKIKNNQSS